MEEEKCCSKKCIFDRFNCVCKLCDHPWCLGGLWVHSDGFCEEMKGISECVDYQDWMTKITGGDYEERAV